MLDEDIVLIVIVKGKVQIAPAIPYAQTIMNTLNNIIPCPVVGPGVEGTSSLKYKLHSILNKYADRFRKTVSSEPAKVNPLVLQVMKLSGVSIKI
jgi:hypothetical protein